MFVGFSNKSYFKTIQDAINASSDNDTIIVENGTYNELLTINKSINLVGSNTNHTIINYSFNNSLRQIVIINVQTDKCKIQNLTVIKNTYTGDTIAIYINSSDNSITNIRITNVSDGIDLGINTKNNTIAHNQILNNLIAIQAWKSLYNHIENNTIFNNTHNGIYIHTYSNENTINNNLVLSNFYGIMIKSSNNNKVYNNCFKENNYGAFICCGSSYNSIYHNIFMNNFINNSIQEKDALNDWYSDPGIGGNYWDDYSGDDKNQDGYGDTPYIIPQGGREDIYPLMNPPEDVICTLN